MTNMFCALGCSPTKNLFIFPSRKHDKKRRKTWLEFFDMEEPNISSVFACERHFSHLQTTAKGVRSDAVPDTPIICDGFPHPFKKKTNNWRRNVIVVTPRDPEFTIYRHETGVFPEHLFNTSETTKPVIQIPLIKSVSVSTQTTTQLCGLVQITGIRDEYHLNCFYCNETFAIEQWRKFINHLKNAHFEREESFRISKFIPADHDYTPLCKTATYSSPVKSNMRTNILPPLLAKPPKGPEKSINNVVNLSETLPPTLMAKPHESSDGSFNISLADQIIKLLNETILSSNFLNTEEDNILIIKNTGSENIETSSFLSNLMNLETNAPASQKPVFRNHPKKSTSTTSSSKYTRPIYTINNGEKNIPSRKHFLSRLFPPLPKNKMAKLVRKRIAQQTLKSINVFENVYKTVKTRPPKVIEPDISHSNDSNNNRETDQEILKLTPLRRCLRRTVKETNTAMSKVQKTTEIVFEYTPKDIVFSLLKSMKNYPVLWEFHKQPFSKEYNKAIVELCRIINDKWSLNITLLKMRRSLNRILRFYRFMLPCESVDKFEEYFDKCARFLPSSADAIPLARCVYCCICYNTDIELRKHNIMQHKSMKWPYKCQHCLERFRESDEYELHKRLPHYAEIYKCEQCNRRFNRRHFYKKHVACHEKSKERRIEASLHNVSQPSFVCHLCNKTFRSLASLNNHKACHRKERHKCPLCSKEFSLSTTLKFHLKRHNKEFDFICEVCGKGFIRKHSLDEHMHTHTGAKVTCKICNLKLRKCSLARHLRLVHVAIEGTIETTFRAKSYAYNVRNFTRPRGSFKRSREKTPRQYSCKICNIVFDRLKLLKDHNKLLHFDVEKMPCQLCSTEFIHKNNLKRHYRDKHKLHIYQVFKLFEEKEDINTVLAMKTEDLKSTTEADFVGCSQNNLKTDSHFEQERIPSDEIQDEIMKAVDYLNDQEIQVGDANTMNEFFNDLLSHS